MFINSFIHKDGLMSLRKLLHTCNTESLRKQLIRGSLGQAIPANANSRGVRRLIFRYPDSQPLPCSDSRGLIPWREEPSPAVAVKKDAGNSARTWQIMQRVVDVPFLSDEESTGLMSSGQTAFDYFQLKLARMVTKCNDIPADMRSKVIESIVGDEHLRDSGWGLHNIIAIAAVRLGLGRIVEPLQQDNQDERARTSSDGKKKGPSWEISGSGLSLREIYRRHSFGGGI